MELIFPVGYFFDRKTGTAGMVYILENYSPVELESKFLVFSCVFEENKAGSFLAFRKRKDDVYFVCSLGFLERLFEELRERDVVRFEFVFIPYSSGTSPESYVVGNSLSIEVKGTEIARALLQGMTKQGIYFDLELSDKNVRVSE